MSTTLKTEWNLQALYTSAKDPRIEKDIQDAEKKYRAFEKKYRNNRTYVKTEKALLRALTDYENLLGTLNLARPFMYFSYRKDLQSEDKEAESMLNTLSQRLAKLENSIIFFELDIAKIPSASQKIYRVRTKRLSRCSIHCHNASQSLKIVLSFLNWISQRFLVPHKRNF
jgi:oligoendopeptidase F